MTRRRLRRTTEEYFGRARSNRAENIEMGKLLLDIVRDLKRVNAHLAAAAYPILEGRAATCCQAG
jgi:phosphate:Na+ symporter